MPTYWSKKVLQKTHVGSSCVISYLRVSGDANLTNKKIHSMLMYPPTPAGVRCAFTFIQTGHEIVVSLAVDQRTFPDPDVVLASFQAELQCLLRQLALRMLTLSQATFLPAPLMARLTQKANLEAGRTPGRGRATGGAERAETVAAGQLADVRAQIEGNINRRVMLPDNARDGAVRSLLSMSPTPKLTATPVGIHQ